jgi:hypothetical protein
VPKLEFVYECEATLSPAVEFGKTLEGQRRIIPITGGTFRGPQMRGELLSGGYDWNLVLIRIVNEGVSSGGPPAIDPNAEEIFFMFTHPSFEAPAGKYDWLNRAMFVGTLGARKAVRNAVLIRVFRLV